jgi:hypothetical protein
LRILQIVILDVFVEAFLDIGITDQFSFGNPQNM